MIFARAPLSTVDPPPLPFSDRCGGGGGGGGLDSSAAMTAFFQEVAGVPGVRVRRPSMYGREGENGRSNISSRRRRRRQFVNHNNMGGGKRGGDF